ncbi:MAG: response regulator [Candidatus Scalindua sp. AMX11]|nr:MAG: response regulator [Candidatus Scalindua sp.]NOG84448.1 response regulator [Planctomycetota bacterium]RZV72437.1 MAG: response regulator [Candidatus Scalindua sp. SCAELEC01]TDE64592.1 MAG: response regulator [Candidatus Scalindua sp. AMX11]GJQ57536.1 MAG: two-component system response regulator [Candidatus Scalindua sp.]
MKKQILFVDDEPCVLNGFRRSLQDLHNIWEMYFVGSVDAALNQIENVSIDVIVSDINMPGKDGFEFLKILRESEKTKNIPVIILTGCKESDFKRRALELGAMDLLNKPVERDDLFARLNSMLRLKSYHDNLEQKVKERTAELTYSRMDIIWRLGNLAEFRDEDTGNHILRVGSYCKVIAEQLGMGQDFIETLFLTSPLHDIGKVGIPDNILLKPGKLTSEEFEIMKHHCVIGAEIFYQDSKIMQLFQSWQRNNLQMQIEKMMDKNPLQEMAATIALTHHEKWNGTGYPKGLSKRDIPLESRIVSISDVFDALSSTRPYKPAFSESKIMDIINGEVGRHFDPEVYDAFMESMEEVREIKAQFSDEKIHQMTLKPDVLTVTNN